MISNRKKIFIFNVIFFNLLISASFSEVNLKLTDISTYLNSIETLEANLIQISSTGSVETGKLFIKKPGKMRFEYDSPSNHLVMASGLLLVVIDKNSNSEPQRYFTSHTPIGYLLDETIHLNDNPALKSISDKNSNVYLSLYDPKKPTSGELELVFSRGPITLKEWTIINSSGEKTRVLLENLKVNNQLDEKLFNIGHAISQAKKKFQ